jgi:hypothetical protein
MTDELKERMARLREIAPRLNSATDQASRLVAMVEKFLVDELHIGVSTETSPFAFAPAGQDERGNTRVASQRLAFGRVGGAYRIHVIDEVGIRDEEQASQGSISRQETAWPSCGRETKLKAFEKLPELLDNIIKESERLAETADATVSKVGELTKEFGYSAAADESGTELAPQIMACPSCGEAGELVNVASSHWGICNECELKWHIGTNLFSSWRDQTEKDWKRSARLLAKYSDAY